jgi:hypothetical protein
MGLAAGANDEEIRNRLNDTFGIDPVFYEITEDGGNASHRGFVDLITGISNEVGVPAAGVPEVRAEPRADAARGVANPDDVRRAEELGNALLERADPEGGDV